jgi:hypothetical protein
MSLPTSVLTDEERSVLRDALAEFIGARVGFPSDEALKPARARAYVEERYAGQTPEWRARKAEEVLRRCALARRLGNQL